MFRPLPWVQAFLGSGDEQRLCRARSQSHPDPRELSGDRRTAARAQVDQLTVAGAVRGLADEHPRGLDECRELQQVGEVAQKPDRAGPGELERERVEPVLTGIRRGPFPRLIPLRDGRQRVGRADRSRKRIRCT
jgi:hypothetical protein